MNMHEYIVKLDAYGTFQGINRGLLFHFSEGTHVFVEISHMHPVLNKHYFTLQLLQVVEFFCVSVWMHKSRWLIYWVGASFGFTMLHQSLSRHEINIWTLWKMASCMLGRSQYLGLHWDCCSWQSLAWFCPCFVTRCSVRSQVLCSVVHDTHILQRGETRKL